MELSVIILNYKVPYHLLLCVESVQRAIVDLDAEIIVADNNSQDESLALLSKYYPQVKQISISENLGFSKGNNRAIREAQGKYICLLNPDTIISEETFLKALQYAKEQKQFGALGVQLIDGSGCFLPESKRNIPTPKIALKKLVGLSSDYYANHLDKDSTGEVSVLVGAFMLVRRDRYMEVGMLDEDYFMYGEDIDLSYQFLKKGYKNHYLGSISCIHFKGESTTKNAQFRNRFYGAMLLFYKKHFQKSKLFLKLVYLILLIAKKTNLGLLKKELTPITIKKHYLVSNNEVLREKLSNYFEVKLIEYKNITKVNLNDSELILDSGYMNFKEIIETIKKLNSTNCVFKILSKKGDFSLSNQIKEAKCEITFY